MKKQIIAIITLLAVSLSLFGCGIIRRAPEQPATEPATEPVTEPVTEPATEPVTEPATEPTTVPTEPTQPEEENLQEVKAVGAYIFDEPSYDGGVVQPMPTGTYTIVKEQRDDEGNLWGKLKSGLGWICLTDIRNFDEPVAIGEPDPDMKKKGNYKEIVIHDSEYAFPVVIQACEKLTEVSLYSCELGDTDMEPTEWIGGVDTLAKGKLLVVWLEFPGDFSTFQLDVVDSSGNSHSYQMATSGRNGTLSVWPVD